MKTNRRPHLRLTATIGWLLACGVSAAAHDFWIEPTAFQPRDGAIVGLHLMVGQDLLGDPVPRDPDSIERFVMARGGDEKPIVGRDGADPAGILRVDRPGLMIVAYHSRPRPIALPPDKFAQYLGEEGLDAIKSLLGPGARGTVAHELFSRCAKALLSSGARSPADRDRVMGLRLELVADRNPYATAPGQDFPVVLLYQGHPQPGALVIAQNRSDPTTKLSARSDARGRVTFRFPRAGSWLIKTVHMIAAPPGSNADWESFWASLTFEIPGAAISPSSP